MAKVEKRQKQEEEAAEKMKLAETDYRNKIEVANQKQNKIKDETQNTARELQVSKNMSLHLIRFYLLYLNCFTTISGFTDTYRRSSSSNRIALLFSSTHCAYSSYKFITITSRNSQKLHGMG